MKGVFVRLITIATVLLTILVMQNRGEAAFADPAATAANVVITNAATATWQDASGNVFEEASNEVDVTVQGVSALTVTPKEATANPALDGYPVGQNVTRNFVISNVSNIPDAYTVASFVAEKGNVVSLAFVTTGANIPITVGSTVSPTLQPGQSITVQVVLATAGVAVGTAFAIHLTAQTTTTGTANGLQSDTGKQWFVAATGPVFTGPGGSGTPISKTVNSQTVLQSQGGAVVTFDVVVKNAGGSPGTNAVMTDDVPSGITADLSTVKINGVAVTNATLNGQLLTVPLGTLDAGATDDISFNSTVVQADTLGTSFVNVASLSADGMPPASTTPAVVLIGTADIVFDPANNNSPVGGATVSLLDSNNTLVPLSGSTSHVRMRFDSVANANTQNPLITGPDGTYGFALEPSKIGPTGTTFFITIAAPGYLNRRVEMLVTPSSNPQLYNVTATSRDGQPIAKAGGYTLTTSSVALNNIFGLFGNLPLFKVQTITIDKNVDRATAQPGDRLVYTIDAANPSSAALTNASIVDTLPAGEVYATGSARMDGAGLEPVVAGRTLTWSFPVLASGVRHQLVYAAVIFPTVAAGTILTNSASAQAVISGTFVNVSAAANAQVQIVEGALSDRSVITGRVFFDKMHTGHFAHGDSGIGSVRVYLEDGTSVLTDREGRFSFPAVRPGMHVLRVDKATLPDGSGGELQRLVHGLLDDGLMEDIEFGVTATP